MMNHRILLSLFVLIAATGAFAQSRVGTFSLIPRIGVSLANNGDELSYTTLESDDIMADHTLDSKYKAGFTGGLDLQYQFHDRIAASLGVYYQQSGSRFQDYETRNSDGTFEAYSSVRTKLDYINVPLMAKFYVANNFSLNIGVQPAFLVNAEMSQRYSEYSYNKDNELVYHEADGQTLRNVKQTTDVKDGFRNFLFSIPIGASYEYENVVLDVRYAIDLMKCDELKTLRNHAFAITVGYKFDL